MKTENTNTGIEEVLEMAKANLPELAIASHETGYTALSVHLDEDGKIDEAEVSWSVNEQCSGGGWVVLYRAGLGNYDCTCDECSAGTAPADWAGEHTDHVADRITEKLGELDMEFAQAQFEREQRGE